MKALATQVKFGDGVRGRIARYFALKDDSDASYLVELLGGLVMFLSSCEF